MPQSLNHFPLWLVPLKVFAVTRDLAIPDDSRNRAFLCPIPYLGRIEGDKDVWEGGGGSLRPLLCLQVHVCQACGLLANEGWSQESLPPSPPAQLHHYWMRARTPTGRPPVQVPELQDQEGPFPSAATLRLQTALAGAAGRFRHTLTVCDMRTLVWSICNSPLPFSFHPHPYPLLRHPSLFSTYE